MSCVCVSAAPLPDACFVAVARGVLLECWHGCTAQERKKAGQLTRIAQKQHFAYRLFSLSGREARGVRKV
eukprot:825867-Pelagomonas_calceolata.AAC.9